MTIAASHLGTFDRVAANDRGPRELAALDRATEWLNSPRLTAASLRAKVVLVDFVRSGGHSTTSTGHGHN